MGFKFRNKGSNKTFSPVSYTSTSLVFITFQKRGMKEVIIS